jgi:hypothetical protein
MDQDKLQRAVEVLGTNWVLHPQTTYDASRRLVMGSVILMGIRAIALGAGRIV